MKIIILVIGYLFIVKTLGVNFTSLTTGVSSASTYFFNLFPSFEGINLAFNQVVLIFGTPVLMLILSFFTIYFVLRITIG